MAEIIDATRNMTLQEIRDRHVDNFNLVHKYELHDHWFDNKDEAAYFSGTTIGKCMQKLGVNHAKIAEAAKIPERERVFIEKQIQKQMDDRGIEVLNRLNYYKTEDSMMRNGIYILYQNEIAYIVSQVIKIKGKMSNTIIVPADIKYLVRTNYKD